MMPSPAALAGSCFLVGCIAVVVVDHVAARIVGVPLVFAGILLGVVAIATPEFLARDRGAIPDGETSLDGSPRPVDALEIDTKV